MSAASSGDPVYSSWTSADDWSSDTRPVDSWSRGEVTVDTSSREPTASTTSATTARNCGEASVSVSLCTSTLSWAGSSKSSYRISSARPDSPGPEVSNTIVFIGSTRLMANSMIISPSHPKIAMRR